MGQLTLILDLIIILAASFGTGTVRHCMVNARQYRLTEPSHAHEEGTVRSGN